MFASIYTFLTITTTFLHLKLEKASHPVPRYGNSELSPFISKIAGSTEVLPWQINKTFFIGLFLLLNVDMRQIRTEFSKLLLPVSNKRKRVTTKKKEGSQPSK